MDLLKDEFTIGMNRLFMLELEWNPTWWVLADVKHDDGWDWEYLLSKESQFLIRGDLMNHIGLHENVTYFERCQNHLGVMSKPDGWHLPSFCQYGGGMSIALQLAAKMNCNPIYIVGADLYEYRHPGPDTNHFHPEYSAHRVNHTQEDWDNTNARLVHSHEVAKKSAAEMGILIYNATVGGALEVYERRNIHEVLNGKA